MKLIKYLFPVLLLTTLGAAAQQNLRGNIFDNAGKPIPYATAALLHPKDSTLAYFGICTDQGAYEIKGVKAGTYLVQSAYMGFKPYYSEITVPMAGDGTMKTIVMLPEDRDLKTVEISTERVPLMIKGDTVEYNAAAFKTKPDANVEDLLRKLPGVQVDRAGNLKAQGEDVKKVLVDGKEFFSNDPKIATKNIPADAIKKVQVFDKTSDQSDFSGIDDGTRDKTINLMLKDDKKNGVFGDVTGGYGTNDRFMGSAKMYNFKPTSQLAALAMTNNINQSGFSMRDYINFKGGIGAMMNGGGLQLGSSSSLPVNFGQQVDGVITSAAGGLNYTYEPKKNHRYNVSYLGNTAKTNLEQKQYTENFTNNQTFVRNRNTDNIDKDRNHGFSASVRNDLDSNQQLTAYGSFNLTRGSSSTKAYTQSLIEQVAFNQLDNSSLGNNNGINGNGSVNYTLKMGKNWPLLRLNGGAGMDRSFTNDEWSNISTIFSPVKLINTQQQFQNNKTNQVNYNGGATVTKRLGGGYFLDGGVSARVNDDHYTRSQGNPGSPEVMTDSLSVDFTREVKTFTPSLSIKNNNDKSQFNAGVALETGTITGTLVNNPSYVTKYAYILPNMRWSFDYNTGKSVGMSYNSRVNAPVVAQLQPVQNIANPLSVFRGNPLLKPEYIHNVSGHWMWFDQFSFTSIFANVQGTYTQDKISLARSVNPVDLSQQVTYANVANDYRLGGNVEFSTPIRPLGLTMEIGIEESYNRGLAPVNDVINTNTNLTHSGELSFKNRNADKLSVTVGASVKFTDARYSLQGSLNNKYHNIGYFADLNYTPHEKWNLSFNADVSNYNSQSFKQSITIPLLQAEVSHFFMKANRASISVKAFDLLNKNSGLTRVSEMNYLQQTQSNIIGRYVMVSFKYKLSKLGAAGEGGGVDIRIKNNR